VVRKNGVLIEAKGALASSTGLNENQISLEILNFSPRKDKIHICRESDRIMVTIVKNGSVRGKVTISAIDESRTQITTNLNLFYFITR
jgi:hypothetical protein